VIPRQIFDDNDIAKETWDKLPFEQQRKTILSILKTAEYNVVNKKVFITLLNSSKVHEFNIDLETSLFRDTPKDVLISKEPKIRQSLLLAHQI
jgi:CHAD domain-containing protein